ncbi:hypothetical protein HDU82_002409 [Entophlyctis luteolus]|nr:hypothetical protein HDU82_002409 [Entophlyctis luteolus]
MASAARADLALARPRIFSGDDFPGAAGAARTQRRSSSGGRSGQRLSPDVRIAVGLVDGLGLDRVDLDRLSSKVRLGPRNSSSNVAVAPLPSPTLPMPTGAASKSLPRAHTGLTRSKSHYNPPVNAISEDIPTAKPRNARLPRMAIESDDDDDDRRVSDISGANDLDVRVSTVSARDTPTIYSPATPDSGGFPSLSRTGSTLKRTHTVKRSSSSKGPPSESDSQELQFLLSTLMNLDIRHQPSVGGVPVTRGKSPEPQLTGTWAAAPAAISCSDTHLRLAPDSHVSPPLHINTGTYTRIRPRGPRHTMPVEPHSPGWMYMYGPGNPADVSMWESADGGFMRGMRSRSLQVDSRTGRFVFLNDRGTPEWAASCSGVDTYAFGSEVQWLSWKGTDPANQGQLRVVDEEGLYHSVDLCLEIDLAVSSATRTSIISGNGRSTNSSSNAVNISSNSRAGATDMDSGGRDEETIRAKILLESIFQASSIFAVNESQSSFALSTITPRPGTYFDPIKNLPCVAYKHSFQPITGIASTVPVQRNKPGGAPLQNAIHSFSDHLGVQRFATVSRTRRSNSFAEPAHDSGFTPRHRRHSTMDARVPMTGWNTSVPVEAVAAVAAASDGGGRPKTPSIAAGGAGAIGAWVPKLVRRMSRGSLYSVAADKDRDGHVGEAVETVAAAAGSSVSRQNAWAEGIGARWGRSIPATSSSANSMGGSAFHDRDVRSPVPWTVGPIAGDAMLRWRRASSAGVSGGAEQPKTNVPGQAADVAFQARGQQSPPTLAAMRKRGADKSRRRALVVYIRER